MYFPQSAACMAPNSANPPSQADIMRVARSMGAMEAKVRRARQAFYCLFYRGDLNTNGWPLAQFGGVPASTISGCPAPASTCAALGATGNGVNLTGMTCWPSIAVTEPAPVAIAPNSPAAYPQPPAPAFPPLTTQAHSAAAKALIAQSSTAKRGPARATAATTAPATTPAAAQIPTPIAPAPVATGPTGGRMPNLPNAAPIVSSAGPSAPPIVASSPQRLVLTAAAQQAAAAGEAWNPSVGGEAGFYSGGIAPSGMGDFDTCSFLTGIIASIGLAAAAMYLWRENGRGFIDGI
jgi:hypothetical protein